jgi:predicted kinase
MAQDLGDPRNPSKVVRLARPSVVVLCGPAACGKSTFAARYFRPTQIISSDHARALVCDDERDQRFQSQAFALVHFLIEQRLDLNRLCVVDSTALTPAARKNLLDLARKYHVPCVVFLLSKPLERCVERDAGRERTVGRAVVERQYQLFEQAVASIKQEGFDQVVEISAAEMEQVKIEIVFRPPAKKLPLPARPAPRVDVPRVAPSRVAAPGSVPATNRPVPSAPPPSPVSRPERVQPPVATPRPAAAPSSPATSPSEGVVPKPPVGSGKEGMND